MRERYHTELESAKQMGYENVEDRYSCDETFCDRVHEDGRRLNDCMFDDMMAFASLPDPPRTRTQVSAGVAANAEHANCLSKLIYMSQPAGVDGFPFVQAKSDQGMGLHVWATCFQRDRVYRINWSKEFLQAASHMVRNRPSSFRWDAKIPGRAV